VGKIKTDNLPTGKIISRIAGQSPMANLSVINRIPQNEDTVNSNNMQNDKTDAPEIKLSARKGSRAEKAQNAMAIYEEAGNVADLPTRSWTREFYNASHNTEKMLVNKIATAEWEKRYAKTDEQAVNWSETKRVRWTMKRG